MPAYCCLNKQEFSRGAYSLVPLRYEDRFAIMRWRNQQIYHLRQSSPLTKEDQQRYFDQVVAGLFAQERPGQVLFSYLENGRCIGYGGLVHINWTDRHAEVSFVMETEREEKEFALHWTQYLELLREVAFSQLKLHKLFTYAFDLRPHLYPVLEACGFVREATLKEHCLFEGSYKDVVIHSLLAYEFVNFTDCTREQSLEVLSLRNQEPIRRLMVSTEPISEAAHLAFVERLKGNRDRLYYAVYKGGQLLGSWNLTREEDGVWDRGLIAAPQFQGSGETARWDRQLLLSLPEEVKAVSAKVKTGNGRSLSYHRKMGFRELSRDGEYVYLILPLE